MVVSECEAVMSEIVLLTRLSLAASKADVALMRGLVSERVLRLIKVVWLTRRTLESRASVAEP